MSSHIMCILIGLISFIYLFFLHLTKQLNLKEVNEENSDFPADELFV